MRSRTPPRHLSEEMLTEHLLNRSFQVRPQVKWLELPENPGLPSRIDIKCFRGLHEYLKEQDIIEEGPHFEYFDICARLLNLAEKPLKARVSKHITDLERLT